MSTKKLNQVLEREKRSRKFPRLKYAREYARFREEPFDEGEVEFEEAELEELDRLLDDLGREQANKKQPKKPRPSNPNQGDLF